MLTGFWQKVGKRLRVMTALRRAGTDTNSRLNRIQAKHLLVLCYGNIYRSPLVARLLSDSLDGGFEIQSAGFHQKAHRSSPEQHISMAARYNIDLSQHRSTVINPELVQWADLIIIMDRHNWYALAELSSDAVHKTIWLGALLKGSSAEIVDPYGESPEKAEMIVQQLKDATEALIKRLR